MTRQHAIFLGDLIERSLVADLGRLARERPLVAALGRLAWERPLVADLGNLAWERPLVANLSSLARSAPWWPIWADCERSEPHLFGRAKRGTKSGGSKGGGAPFSSCPRPKGGVAASVE